MTTDDSGDDVAVKRERELIARAQHDSAVLTGLCPQAFPPEDSVSGYTLTREIGRGGMGVVYEAEQEQPRRAVALKMIGDGSLGDKNREVLFKREIQTLARLRHPAIAAIYEAGQTDNGRHFFTMELVRGAPLTEHVRLKHMSRPDELRLFGQLCEAVHYAHQRGVIHRDLKPSNVLVDGEGNPKILDFGLARIASVDGAVSTASMEIGKIMGTLPYMSPEQARVRPEDISTEIDVRSDVYSLGVMLYELMTEKLPYEVSKVSPAEALRIICEEAPRKPSTISRALRGDLETIVLKALAKEPGRRYDSAAALADDINRYLTNQPILARPASAAYLLRKWIVRHRDRFIFLTVILVILVAFGVTQWWMARSQEHISRSGNPTKQSMEMRSDTLSDTLKTMKARSKTLADTMQQVADSLIAKEEFDEAEKLLVAACQIHEAGYGESSELTLKAVRRLVGLYEAWGKP
ncbi:MAG: serine/threonine protein kinase, partial [Phycisphaerae bacterium]|nr:serine/threonine protein kinase [Phycisphaerae bacterium]